MHILFESHKNKHTSVCK